MASAPANETALATRTPQTTEIDWFDPQRVETLMRMADVYSKTTLIPKHFQGKPNDCFVIMQLAARVGMDPIGMLQRTYVVHGKPGMEAKLMIAMVNQRGPFRGPITYKHTGTGDNRKCVASAVIRATGQEVTAECNVQMAKDNGWWSNNKWQSLTDLMLSYRAASFLINMYCPEVTMGMATVEELADVVGEEIPPPNMTITPIADDSEPEPTAPTTPAKKPQPSKKAEALAEKRTACLKYIDEKGISMPTVRVMIGGRTIEEADETDLAKVREVCQLLKAKEFDNRDLEAGVLGTIANVCEMLGKLPDASAKALIKGLGIEGGIDGVKKLTSAKNLLILRDAVVNAIANSADGEPPIGGSDDGENPWD